MLPPLVLLHAFPLSSALFRFQAAGLGEHMRVIAPDQRGFAQGASDPGRYSLDDVADDVARLLDQEKLDKVALGGVSMGGYAAMRFVARHRDRVRALILSNTKAAADSDDAQRGRATLAARVRSEGAIAATETLVPKLVGKTTLERRPEVQGYVRALASTRNAEAVACALEAMAARPDSTADLARVGVPTLVVAGEEDAIMTLADVRGLAATIPGARLREIAGTGHLSCIEDPATWNRLVLAFLLDGA